MIHDNDKTLKQAWLGRFLALPPEARKALRAALLDLRRDALSRAEYQWRRHKAPMALYWKVVGVYAGHLARALRDPLEHEEAPAHGGPTIFVTGNEIRVSQ